MLSQCEQLKSFLNQSLNQSSNFSLLPPQIGSRSNTRDLPKKSVHVALIIKACLDGYIGKLISFSNELLSFSYSNTVLVLMGCDPSGLREQS